jgi:hypothetical protein
MFIELELPYNLTRAPEDQEPLLLNVGQIEAVTPTTYRESGAVFDKSGSCVRTISGEKFIVASKPERVRELISKAINGEIR